MNGANSDQSSTCMGCLHYHPVHDEKNYASHETLWWMRAVNPAKSPKSIEDSAYPSPPESAGIVELRITHINQAIISIEKRLRSGSGKTADG
jgi:hypothetical protein